MNKRLPILVIFLTSLLLAREALSLPNCAGTWSSSSWNNCFGQYIWTGDGGKYIGEWKDGQMHGQGTYYYGEKSEWSGDKYVGKFRNGERHGQGSYFSADGGKYIGEWKDDKVVEGIETWGENTEWAGDRYVGEYMDDQFHGQGTYTYADGTINEGIFENGEFLRANNYSNNKETLPNCPSDVNAYWHNCFGVYVSTSGEWKGDIYVGEFRDDQFNGQGTYTFLDGDSYVGEWRNGEYHGQGAYIFADGTSNEGIFENGEFLYAANDSTDNNNFSNDDDEILPASSGSGFAVTSDGHIVTNYHVIDGCQNIEITYKGQTIPATVISFDLNNDLALLKSDFKPLYTFPLSRKNPYTLMDIYVAGYPFGYDISTPVKITRGIVSSLAGIGNNFSQVQIDAAIQPGNSGGPIFDNKGNAVGVAVSKLDLEIMMDSYGVVPEGTNFGIKSNVVINFLESNNISLVNTNIDVLSAEALGRMIPDGTYYISCWMTLAQIERMREKKVMFSNLK